MKTIFHLLFIIVCIESYSQIKIDLRKKNIDDLKNDMFYENINLRNNQISLAFSKNYNDPRTNFYEENLGIDNLGCSNVLTYKNQTKIITANFAGNIYIYDLPTGRLEKSINFSELKRSMLTSSSLNKNSIITSLSLTDNEDYLIIKTYNFIETNDKFIDYHILDLSELNKEPSNRLIHLYSLYEFPKMEVLNETKILNTNPKKLQEKALLTIQQLSNSKKNFKLQKQFDGIYFTGDNFVPLKFIQLGDKKHFEAINTFKKIQNNFYRYSGIQNQTDITETISNNYLLSEIIQNSNGTFALFGTSYGFKNNAVLSKIDDLINNIDGLYNKAISEIKLYFKINIANTSNIIEYEKDKLYIKSENNKYYFISPWLNQNNKCDNPVNIWNNSFEWKYYKTINELNNLDLSFSILFDNNILGEYSFMGWQENKLSIYHLSLNQINNFENPIAENQLMFQNTLINKIEFDKFLPINNNSESVVEKQPSKDIGERTCEVCAGSGSVPDKVRNGYIRTFQRNPITGSPVKCFNCSGKGKYTLVTGDFEKKKIIQFDKWALKDVNICNSNKIIILFETNKRTFTQESISGYLTKGELTNDEKLIYSFIIDKNGKILSSSNIDLTKTENCTKYNPIFVEQ